MPFPLPQENQPSGFEIASRKAQRITITISYKLHQDLFEIALRQGRLMSNLCAWLLESSLSRYKA